MIKKMLKAFSFKTGKLKGIYIRICKPSNSEYADYLRVNGGLQSIGHNCEINSDVKILDPYLVRIGNNVSLSTCTLIGHDGSISILDKAYDVKLDSVGPIDIKDNVFIGFGSIILPNVTIGPNAIIAAGAVVSKDVPEGSIYGGVPAKKISDIDSYLIKLKERTMNYPWYNIIQKREGGFDIKLEEELKRERIKFFWKKEA